MTRNKLAAVFLLILAGCTQSDTSKVELRRARENVEILEARLNSCEARLSMHSPSVNEGTDPNDTSSRSQPSEPEYEEKEYYKYDGAECETYEVTACGVNFYKCSNHQIYECMHNVKYTTITKKVLVE